MEQGAGRRELGLDRAPRRVNGRRLRPEGKRSPSTDAAGGVAEVKLGPNTDYAAWRQA